MSEEKGPNNGNANSNKRTSESDPQSEARRNQQQRVSHCFGGRSNGERGGGRSILDVANDQIRQEVFLGIPGPISSKCKAKSHFVILPMEDEEDVVLPMEEAEENEELPTVDVPALPMPDEEVELEE